MALKIKLPKDYMEFPISEIKKIPKIPGIYCFYNDYRELLYVGKSKDLRARVRAHLSGKTNTKEFYNEFTQIRIYVVEDPAEREIYETYMINDLKPIYNVSKAYYEPLVIKRHPFNLGKFDGISLNDNGLTERDIEYRSLVDNLSSELNKQYAYNKKHKTGERVRWSKLKKLKEMYPQEEAKYMLEKMNKLGKAHL